MHNRVEPIGQHGHRMSRAQPLIALATKFIEVNSRAQNEV